VVVPQQDITQGLLTLEVIEARVGQVLIQNEGRIATRVLQGLSSPLMPGQAITQSALDRALLLMSDTPGAQITATVQPGAEVGSSDIVVRNAAGPLLAGSVSVDTLGNRYTGRVRALAQVRALNPLGLGDEASLTLLSSGSGMQYGRLAYQSLVGHTGTQLGAACSSLNYELGQGLQALQAHGTAKTCSTWLSQPLVRSRTWNVEARVQFDAYKLRDRVDSQQIQGDRSIEAFTATLSGDVQDRLWGGAVNSWSVGASQGGLRFNNHNAALSDAASANAAGSFTRWNWSANRLQGLSPWSDKLTLWASASGQGAASNLDSSQKLGLGGPQSVRAYDQGTVSGDQGYQASLELRYLLGNYHGPVQASVFYDIGRVQINHQRWAAVTGANRVTLSGAGVGVSWRGFDRFSLGLSLAAPLGERPELVKQARTGVLWVNLSVAF
jgi:hemolysin activation/secretion protein